MTQVSERWILPVPAFVDELAAQAGQVADDAAGLRLAIALSQENVVRGGSPFGGVVATSGGDIVAAGVNCVLATGLSIAHAEIVTLMRMQQALQGGVASHLQNQPLTLYSSTEPCCQCYGAVVWAGVARLVCGATTADAEAIGFDEGPKPERWQHELERRGIAVTLGVLRDDARVVLQDYAQRGGPIYGARPRD
ncbi:MAG: nucleoside deaminase [Polyangiales bacterium]